MLNYIFLQLKTLRQNVHKKNVISSRFSRDRNPLINISTFTRGAELGRSRVAFFKLFLKILLLTRVLFFSPKNFWTQKSCCNFHFNGSLLAYNLTSCRTRVKLSEVIILRLIFNMGGKSTTQSERFLRLTCQLKMSGHSGRFWLRIFLITNF